MKQITVADKHRERQFRHVIMPMIRIVSGTYRRNIADSSCGMVIIKGYVSKCVNPESEFPD